MGLFTDTIFTPLDFAKNITLTANSQHGRVRFDALRNQLNYAGALQRALFPKGRHFESLFSDHFLLYRPKNLVSGDFYWTCEVNNIRYFACADCTGNAIPAAMLAVFGYSLLNQAIHNSNLRTPAEILSKIDERIIESFEFDDKRRMTTDWIDISLGAYHEDLGELHFCGANRKGLIISESNSYILPSNKYPLGGWQVEEKRKFSQSRVKIEKGSWVYFGVDGYREQFSNEHTSHEKRFGSESMHKLLRSISTFSGEEQQRFLTENLSLWTNGREQTDDVCVLGVKI